MEPVSKTRDLSCNACNRVFNKPEHLRLTPLQRHNLTHTSARPHRCTICGRDFARPDALARHLRIHQSHSVTPPTDGPPPSNAGEQGGLTEWDGRPHVGPSQEPLPDLPRDSYWNTIVWDNNLDSEGSSYLIPDSDIESNSSSHIIQPTLHGDSSPDPLGQRACPVEDPVIARPLPQWSGMESQWMSPLGEPTGVVPAASCEALRKALLDTISMAGSTVDPALFSDRWLYMCHCLFWVKVSPIVPVPHGPTIQLFGLWGPLLMSMLTLGSLHIEGVESKSKSATLWKSVRKIIKMDLKDHFGRYAGAPLLMTMYFSQLFAILSNEADCIIDCVVFQPIPLRLAKVAGLYQECSKHLAHIRLESDDLHVLWEEWIARETLNRTLVALHLLDSTIVSMSDALPTAHHPLNPLQPSSNDRLYRATSAAEWASYLLAEPTIGGYSLGSLFDPFLSGKPIAVSTTRLARGALLEGIYSMLVIETEGIGVGASDSNTSMLKYALDRFYAEYLSNDLNEVVLLLRWHAVCMTTKMARARLEASRSVRHVFETLHGRRALLHANAVRHIVQTCALTTVQAIILPITLYDSALVLLDYIRYNDENATKRLRLELSTDWSRIGLVQTPGTLTVTGSNHVQFLLGLDQVWAADISSLPISTSNIVPFIAVLELMGSVWARCKTYVDDLREQVKSLN